MKLSDINIRDPFVLVDGGKYYLYGSRGQTASGIATGLDVYVSEDLVEWSDPIEAFTKPTDFWADRDFWAPEVHCYRGSYYMFVSFRSETAERGTQILKASSPLGPFLPHSTGPVTPRDWRCLDGTLYVEDGVPYMIFCHEWTQIGNGEMCAMELTPDLSAGVGEPRVLFCAGEPKWARSLREGCDAYVTDGPFLHRTREGKLIMIWSSFDKNGYVEAVAVSDNGSIGGNWSHCQNLFSSVNGGHGMLFYDLLGQLRFVMHSPNSPKYTERPHIFKVAELEGDPYLTFLD